MPPGKRPPADASDLSLFLPSPARGPIDGSTLVNTGLQPLGPAAPPPFQTTFTKSGTFTYDCVIHPNMTGTVTVKAAGAEVDWARAVKARRAKQTSRRTSHGRTRWTVPMGTSTRHADILASSPTPRKVKRGDAVRFVNASHAPPHGQLLRHRGRARRQPARPEGRGAGTR
jgi:plastocyanin